jgi:protein TonB
VSAGSPTAPGWGDLLRERLRPELGRRAVALAVALAIELLLLLALLSLGGVGQPEAELTEISLTARDDAEAAAEQPAPEDSPPTPAEEVAPRPVDAPPELAPAEAPV